MAKFSKLTIKVPEVQKSFQKYSTASEKKANIDMIKNIDRRFGSLCQKWGDVFEIDRGVLVAFIATESGGNPNEANFCCTGLMQVSPIAVFDVANKFSQTGQPLPESVKQVLSQIPNLLNKQKMSEDTKATIKKRLFDPNFNIMCGAMILRWLLERFSNFFTGAQLNKAIIGYNAGGYMKAINVTPSQPIKTPVDTTTYITMPRIPTETKNYLVKMLGVDGFLSLIYKEKAL